MPLFINDAAYVEATGPPPPKSGFRSEGIAWNLLGDLTREPANGATRRPEAKGGDTDTWDAGVLGLPGADGSSHDGNHGGFVLIHAGSLDISCPLLSI